MSKLYNTLLLITGLLFTGVTMAAEDPLVEKIKTYSKSYPVDGSDKITLENKFGELKINTWSKNEIKVDVTIKAEASSDERAQRILDKISIQDGKDGSSVYFKTKIGDNNNNNRWDKGEKQGFSIDYVVYMPTRNPLSASNEFGAMSIGDYAGEVSLRSQFGKLTAGKLSNVKKVHVEFGKAVVEAINNGDVVIKFSRAEIKNLDGDVDGKFEHCGGIKLGVSNNIKSLTIKNSFTQLYLDCSANLSANFDIKTSFSEVTNKTGFAIKKEGEDDERRGPKFDHRYVGKAGSGNIEMKIKSDFGDVIVGHNIPFDAWEDSKKGDKKRTRNI